MGDPMKAYDPIIFIIINLLLYFFHAPTNQNILITMITFVCEVMPKWFAPPIVRDPKI